MAGGYSTAGVRDALDDDRAFVMRIKKMGGRTGFVQGEMLYRSLKVLGRPVEYVRHPGGTHELTRSGDNRQRIDQMLRTYEFFERYLNTKVAVAQ